MGQRLELARAVGGGVEDAVIGFDPRRRAAVGIGVEAAVRVREPQSRTLRLLKVFFLSLERDDISFLQF